VTVSECVFDQNYATSGSTGAIYAQVPLNVSVSASTFSANIGLLSAGAIFFTGGELRVAGAAFVRNRVSSLFTQGGALMVDTSAVPGSVVRVSDTLFDSNLVFAPALSDTQMSILDALDKLAAGSGQGGAIFAASTSALEVHIDACTFASNKASMGGGALAVPGAGAGLVKVFVTGSSFTGSQTDGQGGAILLGANVTSVVATTSFQGNTALNGAVFALQANTDVAIDGCTMTANAAAAAGGVFMLRDAPTLALARSRVSANTAFGGALAYFYSPSAQVASRVTLTSNNISDNVASAGSLYFSTSGAATLPACGGACVVERNAATLYGSTVATLPASFTCTVDGALLPAGGVVAVQSGATLPPIRVSIFDQYGAQVPEWPDLVVRIAAAPPYTGLGGITKTDYAQGGATFDALAITDAIGTSYSLQYTLSSATLPALDGASGVLLAAVAPCPPLAVFDAALRACVCAAGAASPARSGVCTACAAGTIAPESNGATCTACSANTFSAPDGTSCQECPRGSTAAAGSASLQACSCGYGYYASYSNGDNTSFACLSCPEGAKCDGATVPLALPDFWHLPGERTAFYACYAGLCEAESAASAAAAGASSCRLGHTGILCGVCADGFSYQGDFCAACAPEDAFDRWARAKAIGVSFASILLFLVASLAYLLFPLLPPQEAARISDALEHSLQRMQTLLRHPSGGKPPGGADSSEAPAAAADKPRSILPRLLLLAGYVNLPLKILVDSVQIVSSFQRTMRVAWPAVFYRVMAGVNILNFSFLRIPSASCATPSSANFFQAFNGITLGITGLLLYVALVWAGGAWYARRRDVPAEQRVDFTRITVARALYFLNIAYAPLSQVIVGIFGCRQVGEHAYLMADISVQCYTREHMRYFRLGLFWCVQVPHTDAVPAAASLARPSRANYPLTRHRLFLYPFGIPALFLALLIAYRVPAAAANLKRRALLRNLLDIAWHRRVAQPDVNANTITERSITDEHVNALYAAIIGGAAAAVMAKEVGHVDELATHATAALLSREEKLSALLAWTKLRVRGTHYTWEQTADDDCGLAPGARETLGEIFCHFYTGRWFWELFELLTKLVITSALGFIVPGSSAQVVAGLFITFLSLLLYQRMLPYADRAVRQIAYAACIGAGARRVCCARAARASLLRRCSFVDARVPPGCATSRCAIPQSSSSFSCWRCSSRCRCPSPTTTTPFTQPWSASWSPPSSPCRSSLSPPPWRRTCALALRDAAAAAA
jgi:hypothetical protein